MDWKHSNEVSAAAAAAASSTPTPQGGQMHNSMPMPAFALPHNSQDGGDEEGRDSRFMQLLKQNIHLFWNQRIIDIHNTSDFRSQQQLPLARIKKIMKSDEEVKMISADTPILFAKACELFVMELTVRAWLHTEENRRRTLQRCDVARAIRNDELLDFLLDVVQLQFDLDLDFKFDEDHHHHHQALGVRNYPYDSQQFMIQQPYVSSSSELNHERPYYH